MRELARNEIHYVSGGLSFTPVFPFSPKRSQLYAHVCPRWASLRNPSERLASGRLESITR